MERVELCVGVVCRSRERMGYGRRRSPGDGRLCARCQSQLTVEIRELPRLHAICGQLLGGGRTEWRERTSGGTPGDMPFNNAASEARSTIVGLLSSWSALVAEERGVTAPRRRVADLAGFLERHVGWLTGHSAVDDLTTEVTRTVVQARRVANPDPLRRVPVGNCAEPGCAGRLAALVRPDDPAGRASPAEIRCDATREHRWAGHEWTRLGHRMRRLALDSSRAANSTTARADTAATGAETGPWLTATEVSRLWNVPTGSVYRLASERHWRRRSQGGRTYYNEADVATALRGRAPRPA